MWLGTRVFTPLDYYNYGDMNRENVNAQHLQELYTSIGYPVIFPAVIKTDYTTWDDPTVSTVNAVRANLTALVDGFYPIPIPDITPDPARRQRFGAAQANTIEQSAQGLYDYYGLVQEAFKYAGTFVAGQEIVL